MNTTKIRRMQARHRINQFYVFESGRPVRSRSPSVASAAPLFGAADGAVATAGVQSDALKQAAGRSEERTGGFPIFWALQPSAN
jgi:hypothetical protein